MVWGRKTIDWSLWYRAYAWRPLKLIDGRRAWFEWVEVTGFCENPRIEPRTPYNLRLFTTSICARLPETPIPAMEGGR